MKNIMAIVKGGIIFVLSISLALVVVIPAASQSTVTRVIFTSINANEAFPVVSIQVRALDAEGVFVPDLVATQFSIQEDGESLKAQEVTTAPLPLNLNMVFVIDELALGPRLTVVREGIQAFAENHMQAGDQVEVLAASNGGKTQIIVPLTSDPDEVIRGMQEENYSPVSASGTPLLDTINQGLTDLAGLNQNTEGLSRMVVFSVSINDQLDLDETIAKGIESGIPIHTVLLGSEDIKGALGRLARETQAGAGTISPEVVNDLYATLDTQRIQDQYLITYRSKADQPGGHELIVVAGGVSSNQVIFDIEQLESPLVRITVPAADAVITRTEAFFRQDPETIQPTEQTIAVEVNWPDGHPREIVLKNTALVVNGKSLGPAAVIRDNGKDPVFLEFTWDLRAENTPGKSPISIVIEAEDELGLKGTSEPLTATVEYVIFTPPTDACPGLISEYAPALCSNFNLILPLGSLAVAVAALTYAAVYVRRNPKVQQKVKERVGSMMTRIGGTSLGGTPSGGSPGATMMVQPRESARALLVAIEGRTGSKQSEFRVNETTTIGRSSDHAKLVFQSDQGDRSPISRLHCTLLDKDDAFFLRDESSSNGTFINGTRIRSGELHRLSDGDTIELARVQDGGIKLKFQAASRSGHPGTQVAAPAKKDSDDLPKDGYTPTKLM